MISASAAAPVKVNATAEAIAADGETARSWCSVRGKIGVGWTQPGRFPAMRLPVAQMAANRARRHKTINDDAAPISHRFVVLDWSSKGLTAVWLDARDKTAAKAKKHDYRGSALYSAAFDPPAGVSAPIANWPITPANAAAWRWLTIRTVRRLRCGAMCFQQHPRPRVAAAGWHQPAAACQFRPMADRRLPASWRA